MMVNYTGWDQYEALASDVSTNRLTVAGTQQTIATAMTRSRGSWNGTIVQVSDVSFASADARRHFFNQGGFIRILASTSDGSSLGSSWQNMFNTNAGNVDLKAHSTTRSGSGGSVSGALGNYELSGAYQYIYQNFDAGGGAYSANDYYIEAYAASDSLIKIRQTWRDEKGGNPDENVGDLTARSSRNSTTDVIGTAQTQWFRYTLYQFTLKSHDVIMTLQNYESIEKSWLAPNRRCSTINLDC